MSAIERPRALVLRAAGTNCDRETVRALTLAGAEAETIHVERLVSGRASLDPFSILVVPGGFTYGDDLGAGVILATRLLTGLREALSDFVARGGLVLGICNGFQVLVRAGLLPGPGMEGTCTLAPNERRRFESRWVRLRAETNLCPMLEKGESLDCPVAHGEGRFCVKDADVLDTLRASGQIALRYVAPASVAAAAGDGGGPAVPYPFDPNGSVESIAGICDPTGRILGLMPHPERNVEPHHAPRFTASDRNLAPGPGLAPFRRAVQAATSATPTTAEHTTGGGDR